MPEVLHDSTAISILYLSFHEPREDSLIIFFRSRMNLLPRYCELSTAGDPNLERDWYSWEHILPGRRHVLLHYRLWSIGITRRVSERLYPRGTSWQQATAKVYVATFEHVVELEMLQRKRVIKTRCIVMPGIQPAISVSVHEHSHLRIWSAHIFGHTFPRSATYISQVLIIFHDIVEICISFSPFVDGGMKQICGPIVDYIYCAFPTVQP